MSKVNELKRVINVNQVTRFMTEFYYDKLNIRDFTLYPIFNKKQSIFIFKMVQRGASAGQDLSQFN